MTSAVPVKPGSPRSSAVTKIAKRSCTSRSNSISSVISPLVMLIEKKWESFPAKMKYSSVPFSPKSMSIASTVNSVVPTGESSSQDT